MSKKYNQMKKFIKKKGGFAAYREILSAGFDKSLLREAVKKREVIKEDTAVYSLKEGITLSNPDFVAVSMRVKNGVICLISALFFHEATDEIPAAVDVALMAGAFRAKCAAPPVKYYSFSAAAWKAGIEEKNIDGRKVKIYCLAKTVADCFKFRNKIGADTALKALKTAVLEKKISPDEIMKYAKICRVAKVMKPFIEAIL